MKKIAVAVFGVFVLFSSQSNAQSDLKSASEVKIPDLYNYKVKGIDGKEISLSQFKGKKILIVNTASKCGYTPQYKELEELYQTYKSNNFVIIGFPANNFGAQEPGTNAEIMTFCTKNYGVTFPMMEKISVKGKDMAELYQFLTQQKRNGVMDSEVKWNFQKYFINSKGQLVTVLDSEVSPMSPEITALIEKTK